MSWFRKDNTHIRKGDHAPTNRFDSTTVVDRLAGFKWYSPEDVWRKTRRLSLMMTVIIQK